MASMRRLEKNFRIHGVGLHGHAGPMPGPASTTITFTDPPDWDSDGFFDPGERTRVTIPSGFRGFYVVRLTFRWSRADTQPFTIDDRDQGYFYGELSTNADPDGRFQETRISAAPVVNSTKAGFHLLWEGLLAPGDHIEPRVQYQLPRPASVDAWFRMRRLGRRQ